MQAVEFENVIFCIESDVKDQPFMPCIDSRPHVSMSAIAEGRYLFLPNINRQLL